MSNTNNNEGGVGFLGLLAIVFITLKLTEVIDWSWWFVLLPLWGPLAVVAVIFLVFIATAVTLGARDNLRSKKKPALRVV